MEILSQIFLFLKASDLFQIQNVSKKFFQILQSSNEDFWESWFVLHLPFERKEYLEIGLKFLSLPWKWLAKVSQIQIDLDLLSNTKVSFSFFSSITLFGGTFFFLF